MTPVGADQIERANQTPSPGTLVTLYEMDLFEVDGSTLRFTSCAAGSVLTQQPVSFGGELYVPQPIKVTGYEWTTGQQFPRPRMQVSNVLGTFGAAIREYDDLAGVNVSRIKTYSRHLDDGDDPDPDQKFPTEIYRIERKVKQNMLMVEFELASAVDQQGRMLPGRTIQQNACGLRYRRPNSNTDGSLANSQRFDHSGYNVCPYAGEAMFDEFDNPTTDINRDKCGKHLSSCKKRYPLPAILPAWLFPGVGRIR